MQANVPTSTLSLLETSTVALWLRREASFDKAKINNNRAPHVFVNETIEFIEDDMIVERDGYLIQIQPSHSMDGHCRIGSLFVC
jgi:hypothetical protein